ncbi:DUF5057 domain-containing protein [Paenibacillus methanolicus]|uniref:Ig-like protein group 2 n=1 Tax=Paenibacillus methanolicus TaxID=582686 RepID=A0A5S5BUW6_9BACL|nr:DUF5057 domain-containing protein [Paenibacillus methanolicus]TYP70106.1 Ig-like protein group 2 [Paenibacillus methanolicus]
MRSKKLIARLLVMSLIVTLIAIPGLRTKEAYADNANYIVIKAGINKKFITVASDGSLQANSTSVGTSAEWFEYIRKNDTTFVLRSKLNGKYVAIDKTTSTGFLKASATEISAAETFTSARNSSTGSYTFRTSAGTNYMMVENGTTNAPLSTRSTAVNAWEQFTYTNQLTRILEITESGTSDLQTVMSTVNTVSIDTLSMKRFVALRGELDGKYDAIYIGKGIYDPEKVGKLTTSTERNNAHNTKAIENDITRLKATEITQQFINKGQLVFLFSDDSLDSGFKYQPEQADGQYGILKDTFNKYLTKRPSNVVLLNQTGLTNLASTWGNYASVIEKRPRLIVNSMPVSYTVDPTHSYRAGDTLTFDLGIQNRTNAMRNVVANLYMGLDSAKAFNADQRVASVPVSGSNAQLTYKLPTGYSGLYYWKLELVDLSTQLKSYETGVIQFKDQLTTVRVLQVMHSSGSGSSLKLDTNLKQSYLSKDGAYNIEITNSNFTEFNSTGYQNLNGKYDMLIFGFADSYNTNAKISAVAANAVNAFIATGQSVMFTHDTVFSSDGITLNNWISYFQTSTGQIAPWTNMGFSAPKTSTTVTKVNDGLLTLYPFDLSSTKETASINVINLTHNQYFTLDLEDPNVVPWYNITGGTRDADDSWNHYYTYSKGNVTYSGTGHTPTKFPEWEQKLFVNTMYRAFMGSNHAPVITVNNPTDYSSGIDNYIPGDQNISLSFVPDDYDFSDRKLNVDVKFVVNGVEKAVTGFPRTDAPSGTAIIGSYPNPLPNGGDFTIKITVKDPKNAVTTKIIPVKVKKIASNLTLNRTISGLNSSNAILNNTAARLTYTITPEPIAKSANMNTTTSFSISDIRFAETLPDNLNVSGLPSTIRKNGNVISGNLSNITYTYNSTTGKYEANPVTFTLSVTPTKVQTYSLNNASLSYTDTSDQTRSSSFPVINFSSYKVLESLKMSVNSKDLRVGDTDKLDLVYSPADETFVFEWSSSDASTVSVDSIGNITGLKPGTATITVRSGTVSATATVNVSQLTISASATTAKVGDSLTLSSVFSKLPSETGAPTDVSWTVNVNNSKATITNINGYQSAKFNALQAMETPVTVTLAFTTRDSQGNPIKSYSATTTITITDPPLSISLPSQIYLGDKVPMKILGLPLTSGLLNGTLINTVWNVTPAAIAAPNKGQTSSSDSNVPENSFKALAIGKATASASVSLLGATLPVTGKEVTILDRQPSILTDTLIAKGQVQDLNIGWTGKPPSFSDLPIWSITSGTGKAFIDSDNGQLTGSEAGTITLNLSVPTDAGFSLPAPSKTITIVDLGILESVKLDKGTSFLLSQPSSLTILPGNLRTDILSQLTWKSSDPTKVSVNPTTGLILGKASTNAGETVTVTATFQPLNIVLSVKVTVRVNTDKY